MANTESIETHPSFYAPNNHATVYAVTVNQYCTKTLHKITVIHEKNRFSRSCSHRHKHYIDCSRHGKKHDVAPNYCLQTHIRIINTANKKDTNVTITTPQEAQTIPEIHGDTHATRHFTFKVPSQIINNHHACIAERIWLKKHVQEKEFR